MRRCLLAGLVLLLAPLARAQNPTLQGWCETGAQPVVTSGLTSSTQVQQSFPACTITVFVHGGGLATIFADASNTPLSNPFTANSNGRWLFYVASGRYDIQLSGAGFPSPVTYSDVVTTAGGSGGFGPGGSPIQTQVNNSGVFGGTPCENFGNITVGPANVDCDWHPKGPNPYSDVTRYGVRAIQSPGTPGSTGITGSISNGSNVLTVSTSVCASQTGNVCFINGDGITIFGAGPPQTLSTPSAPTVTPSVAQAGTGTGFTVAGPTGATSYQYQVVARDKAGGLTAASAVTAIANGQASLGSQSVSIASISRSGNVVTVTTSAAHTLAVGAEIMITANDITWAGTYQVLSSADNTHFTYITSQDTRNGGIASPLGSFSGTVFWMNCNRLIWPAVPNAWQYYVYGRTSGSMVLLGVTHPSASGDTDTSFEDYGTTMMSSSTFGIPPYVPTSPPVSATSDNLITTISSGAGTTTLTLAATAGTTVAGATVLFDDGPKILAAAITTPNLYFPVPPTGALYLVNSLTDVASAVTNQSAWMYAGGLNLSETLILRGSLMGDVPNVVVGNANTSFTFMGNPVIGTFGNPGIYFSTIASGSKGFVDRISFSGGQNPVFIDSNAETPATPQFGQHVAFQTTGSNGQTGVNDYMGIALYWREPNGIRMGRVNVNTGPGQQGGGFTGSSFTPAIYFRNCGHITIDMLFMQDRGLFFQPGTVSSSLKVNWGYTQGGVTPFIVAMGPITAAQTNSSIEIQHFTNDTSGQPQLSYLPTTGFGLVSAVALGYMDSPPTGAPLITGPTIQWVVNGQTTNPGVVNTLIPGASYTNTSFTNLGPGFDNIFSTNLSAGTPNNYAVQQNGAAISTNPSYPIFIDSSSLLAPTCSVSAGGTWATGSWTFKLTPVWQNGAAGETTPIASAACVTTTGNQTITLTAPQFIGNMIGVNFYGSLNGSGFGLIAKNGSNDCTTTPQMTTSSGSITLSGSGTCGASTIPTVPAGGPTMLMPGVQGIATPSLTLPPSGYDNANRANGGIGANWTAVSGTFTVSGNLINTGSTNATALWSANSYGNNQFCQFTYINGTTAGCVVRFTAANSGNGDVCVFTATQAVIDRVIAGSFTQISGTNAITRNAGDLFRCENNGINIIEYQNGIVVNTAADIFQPVGGNPGLYGTSVNYDNWSGGNLHPYAQLDSEQDWTQPQHFTQPVTIGATNPVPGTLVPNALYVNPLISQTANPALVGLARLATGDFLAWRNNANTADAEINKSTAANGNIPVDTFGIGTTGGQQSGLESNFFVSNNSSAAASGIYRLGTAESVAWRNNANSADVLLNKNSSDQLLYNASLVGLGQTAYLTSTYTNATTTFSNVTGLSFPVAANTNYKIRCDLAHSTSATTTGFKFQWTGPAAPTAVSYEGVEYTGTTTFSTAGATAFSTSTGLGSGTVITDLPLSLTLTLINGANAGTVQLQAAATGAGTLTIIPGSCSLQQ